MKNNKYNSNYKVGKTIEKTHCKPKQANKNQKGQRERWSLTILLLTIPSTGVNWQ